jgi:hypothetical protein
VGLHARSDLRLRQPEVEQFCAHLREHHVARLQIAVRDTEAVCRVQSAGDLDGDLHRLVQRKTVELVVREPGRERLPFEVLHDEERRARVMADIVEGAHLPVIQMRKRLRFAFEALAELWICGEVRRQNLDGDRSLEADVFRPIHLTHAARAKRRLYLIGAESCTCAQPHREIDRSPQPEAAALWPQSCLRKPNEMPEI